MIYNAFFVLNFLPTVSENTPPNHYKFDSNTPNRSLRIEIESIISRYHTEGESLELQLSEVLQNLDQYLTQEDQLMVYRFRLGSDGVFSFKVGGGILDFGIPIPEIIVQVREFIKDLSFRNKKEKQLKTFEVVEKALDLADRVRVGMAQAGPELQTLYAKALKVIELELDKILGLESKGKLSDISENIDHLPTA